MVILLGIDQISKFIMMQQTDTIVILQGVLELQQVKNTGGAFGIWQNNTMMFIITNVVVLGMIIRFLYLQRERMDNSMLIVLLVILAGGFGNLIDRLARGFVIDFIKVFPNMHFPIFNIADMCITIGWIALIALLTKYSYQEMKNKKKIEEP